MKRVLGWLILNRDDQEIILKAADELARLHSLELAETMGRWVNQMYYHYQKPNQTLPITDG